MKPSIAAFLNAAGYSTFTSELIKEASRILYEEAGAGLDNRDWESILSSGSVFESAREALKQQYQDQGFLLANAEHLLDQGYSPAQIENTYRQMQERIGYEYTSKNWALGTLFEDETLLTNSELASLLESENSPPAGAVNPAVSNFTATATTVGATSNEPGKLAIYDGSDKLIGSLETDFTAGALTQTITVTPQSAVTAGTMKISDSDGNFATATQNVILGTAGIDNNIVATDKDEFIYGFGDVDTIRLSANSTDKVYAGADNDTINAFEAGSWAALANNHTLDGGTGFDTLRFYDGNFGSQTIGGGANVVISDAAFTRVSNVEVISGAGGTSLYTGYFNLTLGAQANAAFASGVEVNVLLASELTLSASAATMDITVNGDDRGDTITTGDGDDVITGGHGADTLVGGAGNDTFMINATQDIVAGESIAGGADSDTLRIATSDAVDLSLATLTGLETLDLSTATTSIILTGTQLGSFTAVSADAQDSLTIDTLTDSANYAATAATDTFKFSSSNKDVSITGFATGAGGDQLELDSALVTTGGSLFEKGSATVSAIFGPNTGIFVDTSNTLASADAAGIQALFDGTGSGLQFSQWGDDLYLAASDQTNTYIFFIEENYGDNDSEFTVAADTATLVATLTGVDDAGLLTADNFAGFA